MLNFKMSNAAGPHSIASSHLPKLSILKPDFAFVDSQSQQGVGEWASEWVEFNVPLDIL